MLFKVLQSPFLLTTIIHENNSSRADPPTRPHVSLYSVGGGSFSLDFKPD